ncbi:MAG TPA: hypothetical protein VJM08_10175 [Anaerolineales bacterium]|nr:hypothetical protein [Anaerolineales bacterium]
MKFLLSLLTLCFLFLSACASQASAIASPSAIVEQTVTPTSTPDPCAAENLSESIKQVNDLMREFDDMSKLSTNISREQLPDLISEMQRVRRAAEDQQVPACLSTLKVHQIAHMNTVIETLIAFLGGAQADALNEGIKRAGHEHDLYTLEIARLLGIPQNSIATPTETSSP